MQSCKPGGPGVPFGARPVQSLSMTYFRHVTCTGTPRSVRSMWRSIHGLYVLITCAFRHAVQFGTTPRSRKALKTFLILPQPFGGVKVKRVSPLSLGNALALYRHMFPSSSHSSPGSGSAGKKKITAASQMKKIQCIMSIQSTSTQRVSHAHRKTRPASQRRSPGCTVPQKVQIAYTPSLGSKGTRHGPSHFTWSRGRKGHGSQRA